MRQSYITNLAEETKEEPKEVLSEEVLENLFEEMTGDVDEEEDEFDGPHLGEFNENLAETLNESILNNICAGLLDDIEQDVESRREWELSYTKGIKYLGFKLEDFKDVPFMTACRAFDTTLSTALLRFYSTARAELFPQKGPVSSEIVGVKTQQLEDQAERVSDWMNYYLTKVDRDYYPDSERLLMWVGVVGCVFRKVYQCPTLNRPVARMIDPQDFIVNNDCVSILSSTRLTHKEYLSKKEIILRQNSGFYRDIELPNINDDTEGDESETRKVIDNMEGINTNDYRNKSLVKIYEVHVDLNIEGSNPNQDKLDSDNIPKPYIVTICAPSRRILAIRRNWHEEDPDFNRIEYFTQYNYLPGLGLYGMGLVQLLGSNSVVLTSILRQLIDAGTLKNFPGGLKQKGLRVENNDKAIGPGEFLDIETGGQPIQSVIMTMPYNEPSSVLKELRNELIQQTQHLGSTAETQIAENQTNAPVGTTLALLESSTRIQSSIFRSLHKSLSSELTLIYNLFGRYLPDTPYPFMVPGRQISIMRQDFNEKIRIIPVSDPSLNTSTQKILRAEALLRIVNSAPQIHNVKNAYHRMYEAMNVENIDELLPPDLEAIPLDPIVENMNSLQGKPLKAAIWQDHVAHMTVHEPLAAESPAMQAHIQEHRAMQYLLDMQQGMGMQMPPLDALQNPQIQNQIAMQAAEFVKSQQAQAQENQPQPLDPNMVLMADIQQKEKAAELKSEESKLRASTEGFKAQLKFEAEKNKNETQRQIAEEKNETDLTLQSLKLAERS